MTPNSSKPDPFTLRALPWLAVGAALAVLAATVLLSSLQLRRQTQRQIASRDAEVLRAIAAHQIGEGDDDELTAVLDSSFQKGVLAVRVFDAAGAFSYSIPAAISEARLSEEDLAALRALRPIGRLHRRFDLQSLELQQPATTPSPPRPAPILEALVPLHSDKSPAFRGVAQYLIEGDSVLAEFEALDANLAVQTVLAFGAGGLLLVLAMTWAFRELQRANRQLADRTANLLRANQELALAAKSSAVGAVTSHLIHGLKSPLAGLQQFVTSRAVEQPAEADTEWFHAVATAKRMQTIIADVVRVLREEDSHARYQITVAELLDLVSTRCRSAARSAEVEIECQSQAQTALNNRDANLIILILENLVQNAIQASRHGSTVSLHATETDHGVHLEVGDQGPGLPPDIRASLFTPSRSSKQGGTGIGLAISKQLASHLGADLRLKTDSPTGCTFELFLPHTRSPA